MHSIKTPTSIVAIDEPIKLLTQAEYDAIKNKSDRVYFITDNARKNVIGIIKSGVELNNFSASKIQVTPSGNITKTNAQEAIIENDTHIKDTNITLNSHKSDTSNPHKVTKSQVGLGNADNTSDVNKPVSTAQKKAIDAVNTSLTTHTNNTTVHITAAERNAWNSKAAGDHTHDDRYYTESEINNKLSGKANSNHTHSTASGSSAGLMSAADKSALDILEFRTQTTYAIIDGNSSGEIGFLMPPKGGASRFIVSVLFLNGDYNTYLTWYQVRVSENYMYVCCRNHGAGTWSGRVKANCLYVPDSHVTNRDNNNW